MKINLTVIILTYNEELHIKRCLENVFNWVNEIVVLDSGSSDKTLEICKQYNVSTYFREFDNYSNQRNFALSQLSIKNEWVLFLDADELLSEELKIEIRHAIIDQNVSGYYIKRKFYFQGRLMSFGNGSSTYILRLFRKDKAKFERVVNEHAVINGKVQYLRGLFYDNNLNDFSYWFHKHINYAKLEALDLYEFKLGKGHFFSNEEKKLISIIRYKYFYLIPSLLRPLLFFIYSYIFRFGLLNGRIGLIYHLSHDLIYRYIIELYYLSIKFSKKYDM